MSIAPQRDLTSDPAYSLDNIATIGWTAVSSAHSDPAVATIVIRALEQLLFTWSQPQRRAPEGETRIFYLDSSVRRVLDALEDLVIASTDSKQHQSLALVLNTVAVSLPRIPAAQHDTVRNLVRTITSVLHDSLPTNALRGAVHNLTGAYRKLGFVNEADSLQRSLETLNAQT